MQNGVGLEKKGENEEMRVYLNPEGCGLSCFEEEF